MSVSSQIKDKETASQATDNFINQIASAIANQVANQIANQVAPLINVERKELQDEFLNVKGTSDFLNLAISTIYSKKSRGELPYIKKGKRLLFAKKDLLDYLNSGRVKTNEEFEY